MQRHADEVKEVNISFSSILFSYCMINELLFANTLDEKIFIDFLLTNNRKEKTKREKNDFYSLVQITITNARIVLFTLDSVCIFATSFEKLFDKTLIFDLYSKICIYRTP